MTTNYTATDALVYVREGLARELDGIYDHLAHHYGVERVDGEEYLPEPLSRVMSRLYFLLGEATDMAVEVGLYQYITDGVLMRPVHYTTGAEIHPRKAVARRVGQSGGYADADVTRAVNHPDNGVRGRHK